VTVQKTPHKKAISSEHMSAISARHEEIQLRGVSLPKKQSFSGTYRPTGSSPPTSIFYLSRPVGTDTFYCNYSIGIQI
jgi:hypothetical protein